MIKQLDGVVFAVADLQANRKFARDFGLLEQESGDGELRFITRDNSQITYVQQPGAGRSNVARTVIWGVADEAALTALRARIGEKAISDPQGRLAVMDPVGITHIIQVTQRKIVDYQEQQLNTLGNWNRVDRRSPIYKDVTPLGLGHIVFTVKDLPEAEAFYRDVLGFVESDRFSGNTAGSGIFMRGSVRGPHHHVFIQKLPIKPGMDHLSFHVESTLAVLGGGLGMDKKGWPTRLGPGFHPISSAFYWYVESPAKVAFEYYTDEDYCTEAWEPMSIKISQELYAEWGVVGAHKKMFTGTRGKLTGWLMENVAPRFG